ncbi:MAG: TIGR03032 family protein, partial [Saprospiraceae bacterium]
SIAISTFQAGKVILFSATDANNLQQLPRSFEKAMGMCVQDRRMAVATKNEVVVLADASGLAKNYAAPSNYDALYLPRAVYYVGEVDIHDMAWGQQGLYAVNTRFSCLSLINDQYSFLPIWKPPFITQFTPSDLCHLNGMALGSDGRPKYVTMLGSTTEPKGWRAGVLQDGLVMDVTCNEMVLNHLAMPHSPRLYDGDLYLLLSAKGEIIRANLTNNTYDVVTRLAGFVRGMARRGDYIFVGMSKLRKNASTFRDLPIAEEAIYCGVEIIHLPTGNVVGNIRYQASVEEIYDVQIVPDRTRPSILNHQTDEHKRALNTPQIDFWSPSN